MYSANLGDFFALCVYLQWYYVFIQDVFSHINFTRVYSPQYCIIYHLGITKWTGDVVSTFNVEGWLKSGCNVDQTLLNLKSTLNQLRWKNVLLNETEHIFLIWTLENKHGHHLAECTLGFFIIIFLQNYVKYY